MINTYENQFFESTLIPLTSHVSINVEECRQEEKTIRTFTVLQNLCQMQEVETDSRIY